MGEFREKFSPNLTSKLNEELHLKMKILTSTPCERPRLGRQFV